MARDTLYASESAPDGPFEFSAAVAEVFPDMLQRSIPGYSTTIDGIYRLAARYAQPDTRLYDLGCSLGAAAEAMREGTTAEGCRIVAVDNAPAMAERCRERLAGGKVPVDVLCADIRDVPVQNASMVVMNYTLQFLAPEHRDDMIRRIAAGTNPDGVFLLSEKVVHEDEAIDAALRDLHHDFKRRHAYSELEISRKRAALENVLIPDTIGRHLDRLRGAGFRHAGVWLQHFNFVSILARR